MRRSHYRLSILLAVCVVVAILGGWLHDHRRLRAELDAMRADNEEVQRLKAELSSAKSGRATLAWRITGSCTALSTAHGPLYRAFRTGGTAA